MSTDDFTNAFIRFSLVGGAMVWLVLWWFLE